MYSLSQTEKCVRMSQTGQPEVELNISYGFQNPTYLDVYYLKQFNHSGIVVVVVQHYYSKCIQQ